MKNSIILTVVITASCAFLGCDKELEYVPTIEKPEPPANVAPVVNAGQDIVASPFDVITLKGSFQDIDSNTAKVEWLKVSGPESPVLINRKALRSKVHALQPGIYQFELTVTDTTNLSGKDTVQVTVGEIPETAEEFIFKDLVWINPWYNNVAISGFSTLPKNRRFKVLIKRDFLELWKEVISMDVNMEMTENYQNYEYFVVAHETAFYGNDGLYISYFGTDLSDTPDMKIIFE